MTCELPVAYGPKGPDDERTLNCGLGRLRSAGLVILSLAALAGGCATAPRAPGNAEAEARAPTDAIADYREAVRLDPNSAISHANLGTALVQQGALEEALAEFQQATRLDPTGTVFWLQLAEVYEQMGREEDALHSLELGLEADPGNAGILNQMGWLHATAESPTVRDPEKALAYAQRAVEASNAGDANILDTLAEAYYANREFDKAIHTEERALEIAPGREALKNQLDKFRDAKTNESGH
jgi:tetratricopeptide (TPR) repeat protein